MRARFFAADLFGRHVAGRAEDRAGGRAVVVVIDIVGGAVVAALRVGDDARDAPVEHVDLAVVAEHDVRRLEIAMDDAARVRELDREADVDERARAAAARGSSCVRRFAERDARRAASS